MATAENVTLVTGASLPRFIALESVDGPRGAYLTVQVVNGDLPGLTFTLQQKTRMAAHELVYNADEEGVVLIRAPNGRFWQQSSKRYIVADREAVPSSPAADPGCYFKAFRHNTNGHLLLQSLFNNAFIKRYTTAAVAHSVHASATGPDDRHAFMRLTSAADAAVVLPRFAMFFGNNDRFVGDHWERDINWLKFNQEAARLGATHEIVPLLDGNVAVLNVNLNKFWRRSPNWIWADVSSRADALANLDCQFDIVKLSSTMVAFCSVANHQLLKRYTEYWEDMLCAIGTTVNDPTCHLHVHEAVLSRRLTDIRYLLALAEVSDITPVLVGTGAMLNNSNIATDLEVSVTLTQEVSNTRNWSMSTTFSTSLTVGFSVGVPEVASVDGSITVGTERNFSTEMGTTISDAVSFTTTYKVSGVPPGHEARVDVECTKAKCRVPFTYTSRDTRIDGIDMPPVSGIDGIFEGVNAFNIRGIVTVIDKSGTDKNMAQAIDM